MKRWLTIVVCGVGLATVSAQCGGSKSSDESSPEAAESNDEMGFSEEGTTETAPTEEDSMFGVEEDTSAGDTAVDDTFADPVEPTPEDLGVEDDPSFDEGSPSGEMTDSNDLDAEPPVVDEEPIVDDY